MTLAVLYQPRLPSHQSTWEKPPSSPCQNETFPCPQERKQHPTQKSEVVQFYDKVYLAWYSRRKEISHVAIAINDKPYGFCGGFPVKEAHSLQESCNRRIGQQDLMVTVQPISVTPEESKEIEILCKRDFLPSVTCMHAISQILEEANIHIPFPINLQPEASRFYLTQSNNKRFHKPIFYGSLRYPYLGLCTELFWLSILSYMVPRLTLGPIFGKKIGVISLISILFLHSKAICNFRKFNR